MRSGQQMIKRLGFSFNSLVCELGTDDGVWEPSTLSKDSDRLVSGEIDAQFLEATETLGMRCSAQVV